MARGDIHHRSRRSAAQSPRAVLAVGWLLAVLLPCAAGGCSRAYWRHQADLQTYAALHERAGDPRWSVPRLSVQPDRQSRFYDPNCPDCEPLPPDDPAAHRYMLCADGLRGSSSWHKLGRSLSVENPQWAEALAALGAVPAEADSASDAPGRLGFFDLTLPQALELSLINSREYQTAMEEVYLSALDLTFQRFRFDVQFLGPGGREPSAALTYATVPGGENSLGLATQASVSRLLPTGAQWAVELANNTIWLFTGPNRTETASTLSLAIVQPLLRGAGREVVLEDLTQQERNVLYAVRDLARFRQQFFTDTVAGGRSGGFLGLLEQQQLVRNQEANIRLLVPQVERLRVVASQRPRVISEPLAGLPPGLVVPPELADQLLFDAAAGRLSWREEMTDAQAALLEGLSNDPEFLRAVREIIQRAHPDTVTLDVAQLETRLANSRNALRESQRRLADQLDRFKTELGLPPEMPLTLDASPLQAFELIDPRLAALEQEIDKLTALWAELDEQADDLDALQRVVARLDELVTRTRREGLELVADDFQRVDQQQTQRLAQRKTAEDRQRANEDLARDRRVYEAIRTEFQQLDASLAGLQRTVSADPLPIAARAATIRRIAELREALLKIVQSLQVIQVNLRVELIYLPRFEMPLDEAVRAGLENRLDLMNARAQVMDARRRVELAADRLEGVLDLVAEGDLRTGDSNRPFDFRGQRSSFRAGVAITAPVDQVAARNDYREALITYQRARRAFLARQDEVGLEIRQAWRQLESSAENFERARQAIRFAALQLDQAVEESAAPAAAIPQRQSGTQGLNLINALNSVLVAQNELVGIWVAYERSRLNIHRDMGIMEIDARGLWVDDFYQRQARPARSGEPNDEVRRSAPVRTARHPGGTPADTPARGTAPPGHARQVR